MHHRGRRDKRDFVYCLLSAVSEQRWWWICLRRHCWFKLRSFASEWESWSHQSHTVASVKQQCLSKVLLVSLSHHKLRWSYRIKYDLTSIWSFVLWERTRTFKIHLTGDCHLSITVWLQPIIFVESQKHMTKPLLNWASVCFITAAKEVMSSPMAISLLSGWFVSKIPQKTTEQCNNRPRTFCQFQFVGPWRRYELY